MKTTIIPDILTIQFNKPITNFNYFSLGEVVDHDLFSSQKSKYNIDVNFVNEPLDYATEKLQDFSSYYKVGEDSVYIERRYAGIACKMLVTGMKADKITAYLNKSYYKLVRFKLDNLYPPAMHLNDIIMSKMLANDDLVLHSASLESKNGAFAIIAPPDTGKTYTTYKLLENNYKFLGEDLSYYSNKDDSLYCMPYTSTWGHHFSKNKRWIEKIPFVQLFIEQKKETVDDLFNSDIVCKKSKLDRLYIIEKGSKNSIKRIKASDEIIDQLMSIQRNEFSYFKNPLIRAYEYFNGTKIDAIYEKERANFTKLIKSKEVYKVVGTDYSQFKSLIDKNEKNMS